MLQLSVTESQWDAMTPATREMAVDHLHNLQMLEGRDHLIDYVCATYPQYRPGKHHYQIAERLEAVERGEISRLLIFAPPRSGKSELVSARFPLWYLGRQPRRQIIAASYGGTLAGEFGRQLRNLTHHPVHRAIFPNAVLRQDSQARDHWVTTDGGVYIAAGIGGAITGYGANLLIIDDPVRSVEDANSETIRDNTWNWYTHDAYTRLMTPDAIVICQTRWHEDDLSGRLIADMEADLGDTWEILHLQAIDEMGQALWPEKYDVAWLERRKKVVGPQAWQALYQGNPTPEQGTYFMREWILPYDYEDLPPRSHLQVYGASDYAVTENDGDYTVHLVVGVDPQDRIYILDMWRRQTLSDAWVESLLDMAEKWKPLWWIEEKAQIEKSVGPFIEKRQRERKVYFSRLGFSSAKNKSTKARAIQGRMGTPGMVWFPRQALYYTDICDELLKFPAGKNDDIVDCLSLIGRMLAALAAGKIPKQPARGRHVYVDFEGGEMDADDRITYDDAVADFDRRSNGRIRP